MRVSVLLLAAGGSTRMRGGDKLLEAVEGEPLLRRSARTALDSAAEETLVVLGANRTAREAAVAGLPVRRVANAGWEEGMGTSIAAGAAALSSGMSGVLVMAADMPDLTPGLIDRLIAALPADDSRVIARPCTDGGVPGNPVLFGAAHLPALAALRGDTGAREVVAANRADLRLVPAEDNACLLDLDTPEAWQAYRNRRV